MAYGVTKGFRLSGDVNAVGGELASIHSANGKLTADIVVDEAKNPRSALHGEFEWDDSKAAHEHRLQHARSLIRSITVVYEEAEPVRHYVRVSQDVGYQPIEAVVKSVDLFALALDNLERKLLSAQQAVHELQNAAASSPHADKEKLSAVTIALTALHTARDAVMRMH